MGTMNMFYFINPLCFFFLLFFNVCGASTQYIGQIYPGLEGSQMNWIDKKGFFLLSNNSIFALGFSASLDVTLFSLVIIHLKSLQVVWTANRGSLVKNNDKFVFEKTGNAYLGNATNVVWSTNTGNKGVTVMELLDTGNLILLGKNKEIVWQSFSYPTDTLLSGQKFDEGMKLKSFPYYNKLYHYLEIKNGDLISYAGYQTPQVYWSMSTDSRKKSNKTNSKIVSASVIDNSWDFYDRNRTLVWQFNISEDNASETNSTWAIVLGTDGSISFYNLERGKQSRPELTRIPKNPCSTPEPCGPFHVCSFDSRCQCPSVLSSFPNCTPQPNSPCKKPNRGNELLYMGEELDYFALKYVKPVSKTQSLGDCKEACLRNCSCVVLFFQNSSRNCFLFNQVGSLKRAESSSSSGVVSYVKVFNDEKKKKKHHMYVAIIVVGSIIAFLGLAYLGFRLFRLTRGKKKSLEPSQETSDEENFLGNVSGRPARFSYNDLIIATNNFSLKLGQGGFGSVYQGVLLDGSEIAVKKLEGIGQGKKEFRAEVSIIGSIHHLHLVNLKGFCAEGSHHRLLVYEYLSNSSLDKWIFKNNREGNKLDWEKRFNIVLGMAKGLAYLHEGCDVKIVHCDIKPENVLLDNNFQAKVSDFGLAKLMTREQSHVFTVVRGTRGYLAPEWIMNYAISEKSDVYSFGMVVLEIIGGRKNFDPDEISEKAHFPSYVFKKLEEGKLDEILGSELESMKNEERVINTLKVALCCIQDDMHMRPSMSKVVRMLEGICPVPEPPINAKISCGFYSKFLKSGDVEGDFSKLPDYNSIALLSNIQLSGPR